MTDDRALPRRLDDAQIPSDITVLLHRWGEGDREAFQQVFTLTWRDFTPLRADIFSAGVPATLCRPPDW